MLVAELMRLRDKASSLGFSEEDIRSLLSLNGTTFARIRSAVETYRRTKTEDARNRKYITEKGVERLRFACEFALRAQEGAFAITVKGYETRIVDEFSSLDGDSGDSYDLVLSTPPLEYEHSDVRHAVIRAAHRGVAVRYYYPSAPVLERATSALGAHGAPRLLHAAWWQSMPLGFMTAVRKLIETDALVLDIASSGRDSAREFQVAAAKNIHYFELWHLPVPLNEKTAIVTKGGNATIRQELLLPSPRERAECSKRAESRFYQADDRWLCRDLKLDVAAIRATLDAWRVAGAQ